jgi:hypothetical protein
MNIHVASMRQAPPGGQSESGQARCVGEGGTSIYRPVLIHVGGFSGFCLLRHISGHGFAGMVYADLPTNDPVTIDFSDKLSVEGRVEWSTGGRIGVRFNVPVDVPCVIHELGRKMINRRVNRAPRLDIRCPVTLETADRSEDTVMHDISQRGVKVSSARLAVADEVFVHLDGMETRKAVVRWAESGMAGLNFVRPLEFDKLANWAFDLQAKRWKEGSRRV